MVNFLWVVTLLVMVSIFFVTMALRTHQQRSQISTVGASLARNMLNSRAPDPRQMKLRQPFSDRVLKPILRQLYGVGRRLTPSKSIGQLQEKLIIAGMPGGLTVTVTDAGTGPTNPFVGLLPADHPNGAGLGLWIAHQLVDVTHRRHPDGYTVRLATTALPVLRTQ